MSLTEGENTKDTDVLDVVLEKQVKGITVRVIGKANEKLAALHSRLLSTCDSIERLEKEAERAAWTEDMAPEVEEACAEVHEILDLDSRSLEETGVNADYPRVMISLLCNFDKCMGSTDVSEEWGGINTGSVSRVFRASRTSTEEYERHFEKCPNGKYRFTYEGLEFALQEGLEALKHSLTDCTD